MKTLAAELGYFLRGRARQNLKLLVGYAAFLVALIFFYSWMFDYLMLRLEGRRFSLASGVYWTITAMTTLGYGDITFETDGGRIFSAVVTLSGVVFILVFLPFGMISLFLAPWLEQRLRYHPPDRLPANVRDHVLLAGWDPLAAAFVTRLRARDIPYAVLESDHDQAVRLDEHGVKVVHGIPTDAETFRRAQLGSARAVVANLSDPDNVNLILTARSLCAAPILAVLRDPGNARFLELAGATSIFPLKETLGRYLAVRATTQTNFSHVVDSYEELLFAELPVQGLELSGRTVAESRLREETGVSLIGIWERGELLPVTPQHELAERSVIVIAATEEQLKALERFDKDGGGKELVLILGFGAVGQSAADFLRQHDVPFRVVEKEASRAADLPQLLVGDASQRETLVQAGIQDASGLIVTTHDDGMNVFLTLVGRHLNPRLRIVSRANREENVDELYAAGADFVVSLVSVGANMLMNSIEQKASTFLTEGVQIFWQPVTPSLAGQRLRDSNLRQETEATVVAIRPKAGGPLQPADPDLALQKGMRLLVVGTPQAEESFSRIARG